MKFLKKFSTLSLVLACLSQSCDRLGDQADGDAGQLCISFFDGPELSTKANPEMPDTNDFILNIKNSDGKVIYNGKFGDYPEKADISPGNYTITVTSEVFTKPAFDFPVFGDEQCAIVTSGKKTEIKLVCSQMNAGMKLLIGSDFLTAYPDAALLLKSGAGRLMYSYSEKRTAYFQPGTVSLIMSKGGSDEILMTRELEAREMLTIKVNAPSTSTDGKGRMTMEVDTSRIWHMEEYTICDTSTSEAEEALTVSEARKSAGAEDVWVSGYIIGGDLTSSSASFEPPFKSATNLLLGPKSSTTDKNSCISVQLTAGSIREALNLVGNPELLGKRICIKGDIVDSYYGIPGIKNISEHRLIN